MNPIKSLALVVVVTLPLAACGDPLTKDEAKAAWPTTGRTLHDGEATANPLTAEIGVAGTAPCEQGGNMEFKVDLGDLINAMAGSFGFDVEFNDCKNNGLTMDGEVHYSLKMEADGTNTLLEWGWEGDLSYDGTVDPCLEEYAVCTIEGDCEFDLVGRISVTSGGNETDPTTVELTYEGDLCGYEAGTWLNVTTTP